ncbi:flippase [Halegenticoccus soli]|uniref:flippase n=1 Tax=Halegenticoccus soli TaxID=1985678 RepID=UPI000C6E8761|nr:flippase [Halegenticoccus soli]
MPDRSEDTLRTLFASSGVLLVGIAFQLGLGFFARMLIARFLGKVNYGAVSLGLTLLTTASILVLVGMDSGIGRYLPRYEETAYRRGVLVSAYQLVVPLASLLGIGVALLAGPIAEHAFGSPEIAPVLRVFALAIPFAAFVRLTVGSIQGMQQSVPRVLIENFTLPTVRFVLIAAAVIFGFQATGVAWAYAGAYGLAAAVSLYYLVTSTPLLSGVRAVPMHRDLLAFSVPLMVMAAMNMIFQNLDTFMLGVLASTGDVGVYNVVYPVAQLLTVTLTAFGFLFMPVISEFHSDGDLSEMRRVYQIVSKWIFLASLPLFLVIASFPTLVIRTTFGSEYASGGLALAVLAVGFFTHTVFGPNGNALTAIGKSRTIMYDNVLVAVVNAALNLVLIPKYSFLGAAVATTVGYFLMNGLFVAQLYREIDLHPFRRALVRPGIVAVVCWGASYWGLSALLTSDLVIFSSQVLAFAVLYPIVVLAFGGIEPEDLGLIASFEDRVGVDLAVIRRFAKKFAN